MSLTSNDYTRLTKIYREENSSMIENLGKNVVLVFIETVTTEVAEDIDDNVRGESFRKPVFKDNYPTVTETTRSIKALVQYNPADFKRYDNRINMANNILRMKTYISELPYLKKCDYIIPDYDVKNDIFTKFKLVREPIPIGLKEDTYCISYWERVL